MLLQDVEVHSVLDRLLLSPSTSYWQALNSGLMPPAAKPKWERRPQRKAHPVPAEPVEAGSTDESKSAPQLAKPLSITAVERRQLYARLLWLGDQNHLIFQAEAAMSGSLLGDLRSIFVSTYTMRLMQRGTAAGEAARLTVDARLQDNLGFLERSRNRLHVPISQVTRAISFLASGVVTAVWITERKARRVVGRQYALDVLREMSSCRPPPPFQEQDRALICSIGFDQTYAKAGAGTGTSSFNPIQTVDSEGKRSGVERMVYINGQFFPAPYSAVQLSADAIVRISETGPYTQDFRRILPLLQPLRLDGIIAQRPPSPSPAPVVWSTSRSQSQGASGTEIE